MYEDLPYKEICFVDINEWHHRIDGSFTHQGGVATVVFYDHDSTGISLFFKLKFLCPSTETAYEALVIGLFIAYTWEFEDFGCKNIRGTSFNKSLEILL